MLDTSLRSEPPHAPADIHAHWMRHALRLARQAAAAGEVPVGAVVVKDGVVVGEGCNAPIAQRDPTAHAEVLALRQAAQRLGNYRLEGCTLYVTLEPCVMCSGALLHARVDQVVYGASEPKTGAAGSVLDVFACAPINHHTTVLRGVLETECAALMADFFQQRRAQRKALQQASHPLQDTALRNPDAAFAGLPHWPYAPTYHSDWPALQRLRVAVVDEGPQDAARTWLCVHGSPGWGYVFRHLVPVWLQAGHRVVMLDWPGFGRSDQPKKPPTITAAWLQQVLIEAVQALALTRTVLVGQGDGALLALAAVQAQPARFDGLWLHDVWPLPPQASAQESAAPSTQEANALWPLPPRWQAQLLHAARKPQWPVGAQLQQAWGLAPEPAAQAAFDAPFARPGHRAALQAWPHVRAQLLLQAGPVAAWLQAAVAQRRCWITHTPAAAMAAPLYTQAQWQQAWQHAVPALANAPQALACNPEYDWGAPAAADGARRAVEYFGA